MEATYILPVELLAAIFKYACTDGGYTGCSLARVSKTVRDISREIRFQAVALDSGSAEQYKQFLSCIWKHQLRAKRDHMPAPQVRHLFLAAPRRQVERADRQYTLKAKRELEGFTACVVTLLDIVGPGLYTLSVHDSEPWYYTEDLHLPDLSGNYPLLEDLCLIGRRLALYHLHHLPRLTRLHLTCKYLTMADLGGWDGRAPNIRHLRLTDLDVEDEPKLESLIDSSKEKSLLQHLKTLVVEASAPPLSYDGMPIQGDIAVEHDSFRKRLTGRQRDPATRPWVLLPHKMSVPPRKAYLQAAKRDWEDRLQGGPGCWATDIAHVHEDDDGRP
ncbi:hypothetical protein K466DRAFT_658411 [Polyporus arcularius HHB13444]|uniref:F-box domain-containing protein n=1 Tax=Polyporus arcularius HHB13444 TaxID=1314778 RepID=A0A5C3PUV6_9APHY|nr:hypothetical protein K466DRAFT_658411 [Polyporus arcularius HHB13444]